MKSLMILLVSLIMITSCSKPAADYPIRSLSPAKVKFTAGMWLDRFETTKNVTIPHVFNQLEETGRIDNMLFAAGEKEGTYCTHYIFDDSDVYKSIEAVAFALMSGDDPQLEQKTDSLIKIIGKMQEEDGYLYSPRSASNERVMKTIGQQRWSNLQWNHELYCAGHMYEAAVAWYEATGKKNLLDVAIKNAELILQVFNADSLQIPPGHQEIELGLVRLYQHTGDQRYLDQAKFFLDIRGRGKELNGRESWGEYAQDHLPAVQQEEAVGHAVRAAYMYASMTDMAALYNDQEYADAVLNLWDNVVTKKLYITGGIGSTGAGEALGPNYDLPNASAYNETCSSIALMNWNFKMYQYTGDSKYLDIMERTLYNAFLSGIAMEGNLFFYPNPLQSFGTHYRAPWFRCACCPPNVSRFILSLPGKIYSASTKDIIVNFYTASSAEIDIDNRTIHINQETKYPWDGKITLTIDPGGQPVSFDLKLRIPGWAQGLPVPSDLYRFMETNSSPKIKLNGNDINFQTKNGFAVIQHNWKKGDQVELILPMDIHRVLAIDSVEADRGRVALQRGPIIYAAEWPEFEDGLTRNILLEDNTKLTAKYMSDLLNGVSVIEGNVKKFKFDKNENLMSYPVEYRVIPYYAWAHRGTGEMNVWLAREKEAVSPAHSPTLISRSKITVSSGKNVQAVNDLMVPKKLPDAETPRFHWWPNKGTEEWVQIDFPETSEVSQISIFWFDDTGRGECRVPKKWDLFYRLNNDWRKVYSEEPYTTSKDEFNTISFETVRTKSLKLVIKSQENFAGGIYEMMLK